MDSSQSPSPSNSPRLPRPPRASNRRSSLSRSTHDLPSTPTDSRSSRARSNSASHLSPAASTSAFNPASSSRLTRSPHRGDLSSSASFHSSSTPTFSSPSPVKGSTTTPTHRRDASTSLLSSASTSFTPTPTRRDSLRYTPTRSDYSSASSVREACAASSDPRAKPTTDSPTLLRRDASPALTSTRQQDRRQSRQEGDWMRSREEQHEVDTASLSSGSQYSLDEKGATEGAGGGGGEKSGEESDPWMGVDLGDESASPPRSPLLAENVARMKRVQSFGELGMTGVRGTEPAGSRMSIELEDTGESQEVWDRQPRVDEGSTGAGASWGSRRRSRAEYGAFSGPRAEVDENDERQWRAQMAPSQSMDADDTLDASEEDVFAVYSAQRGERDVDYGLVPDLPLVTSASQVGLALGGNDSEAEPAPSCSSYQPTRPFAGTPPVSPHRQVSPSRKSQSDHLSRRSSVSSTSSLLRSDAISVPLPRSRSRSRSPVTSSAITFPADSSTPRRPAALNLVPRTRTRSGTRSSSRTSSRGVMEHRDPHSSPASLYSSRPATPDTLVSLAHDDDWTPVRSRPTHVALALPSDPDTSYSPATGDLSAFTSLSPVAQPAKTTPELDDSLFLQATPSTSSRSSSVLVPTPSSSTDRDERRPSTEERRPSMGDRRASKPRREPPLLKAKSSRRSNAVTKAIAVNAEGDTEASCGREGEGEDQSLSVSATMREMSLSELGGLRASGSTPLLASDFADVYGDFNHSPSAYDSELPHTHAPHYIPLGVEASPPTDPAFVPNLAVCHADSESSSAFSPPPAVNPITSLLPTPTAPVGLDASPVIPDTFFEATEMHPSYASSYSIMEELDAQISHAISHVNLRATPSPDAAQARRSRSSLLPAAVTGDRPTSQAVSDVSNDASVDVYHDAPMSRGLSGDRAGEGGVEPIERRSAAAKSDAKARAAAFIADLKRSKAAAIAAAALEASAMVSAPSPTTSASQSPAPEEDLSEFEDSVHATPVGSTRLITDLPPLPPLGLSPLHTPTGPPSNAPRSSATPAPTIPPRAAQAASHALQSATTGNSYDLSKLLRRRPLPACLHNGELREARSPAERAKIYARKINALGVEESGLHVWIGEVKRRAAPRRTGFSSTSSSPQKAVRHSREDPSNASSVAFPVRNDGFRAKEIPFGQFGPGDMAPTVPYPGVLQSSTSSISSRQGGPAGKPPSAIAKSSFFSTLSRKGSKRSTPPSQRSQGGYVVSSPLGTIGVVSSASGLRPAGPRMPGTTRSSLDLVGRGGSPGSLAPPQLAQRASFTYGSLDLSLPTTDVAEVSEDKLQKLVDILPQADRETLRACLARAGDDDVLAISVFLSEEQNRRR